VVFNGGSVGLGFPTDGVYGGTNAANGSAIELTTAWAITAGLEHYWTPALRTSLYHGADHQVVEGAGHLIHLEPGAEEVARDVVAWLEEYGL